MKMKMKMKMKMGVKEVSLLETLVLLYYSTYRHIS